MRQLNRAAFLAVLCLSTLNANAEDKTTRQAQRKISTILTEFNEEMRGYEREMKYFERVAEFKTLFELRNQLDTQAVEIKKLDDAGRGTGPAILERAREMDRTARKLDAVTVKLEKRAEAVSSAADRTVAERMKTHANTMLKTVDELIRMFR